MNFLELILYNSDFLEILSLEPFLLALVDLSSQTNHFEDLVESIFENFHELLIVGIWRDDTKSGFWGGRNGVDESRVESSDSCNFLLRSGLSQVVVAVTEHKDGWFLDLTISW